MKYYYDMKVCKILELFRLRVVNRFGYAFTGYHSAVRIIVVHNALGARAPSLGLGFGVGLGFC